MAELSDGKLWPSVVFGLCSGNVAKTNPEERQILCDGLPIWGGNDKVTRITRSPRSIDLPHHLWRFPDV